jgi:hypothetical protein
VVIVRSTIDSEVSPAQAAELAALWRNGHTVDVEGGYLLFVQNPAGTAAAINNFIANLSPVGANV